MNETVMIPAQFNGPPSSGNGGYAAGAFAEFLEGAVEVTLRSPPPLGQQMQVVREENGLVVRGGETLVGEVRPCTLSLDVPDCPDARAARTAVRRFVEFKKDDFQRCFVCGAERAVGDGLCLRTGPIDGSEIVATEWIPHENSAGTNGLIPQYGCHNAFGSIDGGGRQRRCRRDALYGDRLAHGPGRSRSLRRHGDL